MLETSASALAAKRRMVRNLKGLGGAGVAIHALCGDDFWDAFITAPEIRHTYQAQMALALQNDVGAAWESFRFAGVTWHNYRGTDDNSTVAILAKKVKFFPVGAPIFQIAHAPAERFEFVNTPGQETYSWIVPDRDRDLAHVHDRVLVRGRLRAIVARAATLVDDDAADAGRCGGGELVG